MSKLLTSYPYVISQKRVLADGSMRAIILAQLDIKLNCLPHPHVHNCPTIVVWWRNVTDNRHKLPFWSLLIVYNVKYELYVIDEP